MTSHIPDKPTALVVEKFFDSDYKLEEYIVRISGEGWAIAYGPDKEQLVLFLLEGYYRIDFDDQ